MVIKKMERQKEFQNIQSVQIVSADTLFSRIEQFEPGVNASYEENDIKFLINDLAKETVLTSAIRCSGISLRYMKCGLPTRKNYGASRIT